MIVACSITISTQCALKSTTSLCSILYNDTPTLLVSPSLKWTRPLGSRLLKRYQTILYHLFFNFKVFGNEYPLISEKRNVLFSFITNIIRFIKKLAMYSYIEVNVPVEGPLKISLKERLSRAVLCRHLELCGGKISKMLKQYLCYKSLCGIVVIFCTFQGKTD